MSEFPLFPFTIFLPKEDLSHNNVFFRHQQLMNINIHFQSLCTIKKTTPLQEKSTWIASEHKTRPAWYKKWILEVYNLHLTTHYLSSHVTHSTVDSENRLVICSFSLQSTYFGFLTLMLCTLLLRVALHSQFLSEFPSNTWDKGKFKVFDIWTRRPLNPPSPQVWPSCKSCSLSEIQMSNSDDKPIPNAFRRISNWFLPSHHQFPWSAHLAVIIVTYNGDNQTETVLKII